MQKDHEFCLRCGRKLRNPDARQVGYGAVCLRKMKVERSRQLFDADGKEKEEGDLT